MFALLLLDHGDQLTPPGALMERPEPRLSESMEACQRLCRRYRSPNLGPLFRTSGPRARQLAASAPRRASPEPAGADSDAWLSAQLIRRRLFLRPASFFRCAFVSASPPGAIFHRCYTAQWRCRGISRRTQHACKSRRREGGKGEGGDCSKSIGPAKRRHEARSRRRLLAHRALKSAVISSRRVWANKVGTGMGAHKCAVAVSPGSHAAMTRKNIRQLATFRSRTFRESHTRFYNLRTALCAAEVHTP